MADKQTDKLFKDNPAEGSPRLARTTTASGMSRYHFRKANPYHYGYGEDPWGLQGYPAYGDPRSYNRGMPSPLYDGWTEDAEYQAPYQEQSVWSPATGHHGNFSLRAATTHPGNDSAYRWTSGQPSGSACPRCGTSLYAPTRTEVQTQRQILRCPACGMTYPQPIGTGLLAPNKDFYDTGSYNPYPGHYPRAEWNSGGPPAHVQLNSSMAYYQRPRSAIDTHNHQWQKHYQYQLPYTHTSVYDYQGQGPYPTTDTFDHRSQGIPVSGHSYTVPNMDMSRAAGRGMYTSYLYTANVYATSTTGGVGSSPYGNVYGSGR